MTLSNSDDVKQRLRAFDTGLWAATEYQVMLTAQKSTGKLNLFLGALNLWLGVNGLERSSIHLGQIVFGVLLIAQSLSSVAAPSLNGMLRFSFLFMIAGLWNIGLVLRNGDSGLGLLIGLLGGLQLYWAYDYFRWYRRLNAMGQPATETRDALRDAATTMNALSPEQDDNLIEYKAKGLVRVWLFQKLVLIADSKHEFASAIKREDFDLHFKKRNKQNETKINVLFKLNQRKVRVKGLMPALSVERYQAWKAS